MAKGVYVKDQGVVEFPDETDEQTMLQSLRRKFSNLGQSAIGAGETALSIGSAALAEPVSGLAGLVGAALPGEEGQGARFVQSVGDAMTYEPMTEKGVEYMRKVAEILQPVGEVIQGASQTLGDKAYSATGSPALAAAAYSAPTAFLEGLGLKGLNIARKPVSGADLYSARMGASAIGDDSINPLLRAVYSGRKSFFDDSGNFDYSAYRNALYDAEDAIDADTFDAWQNSDWQAAAQGIISDADKEKVVNQVKSKTLYHGSPYEFNDLYVPDDGGAFLTGSIDSAKHYADGGNVYEYKIQPKKPFFANSTDSTYDIEQSGELTKLKKQGYDSIIPLDGGDYVVLDKAILRRVK